MCPRSCQNLGKFLSRYYSLILSIFLLKYDLLHDLTLDPKEPLAKILNASCQELIKNLARFSQDLVGIYIRDLSKILIRSYRILSILLVKYYWQDLMQDITKDFKVFLTKVLETSGQELLMHLARSFQDPVGIYISKILARS